MLFPRRVCTALAVAFVLYPVHQQAVRAHRADADDRKALDLEEADERRLTEESGRADSRAMVPMSNHSLLETKFLDPVTLTVMGGIAAAGSLVSIGKTIKDARARSKENKQIANVIKMYQHQSQLGCDMLDTAASFLVQKLTDLDIIASNVPTLDKVCGNRADPEVASYQNFLKNRLSDICTRSPSAFSGRCHTAYTQKFEENVDEACGMSTKWGTQEGAKASRDELIKHIWQMDGLKRGTCGRGLNGVQSLSFLQENQVSQVKSKVGVPILDILGLAFTLCGYADMLVAVGDHTIVKVWGTGVQGLLAFTEAKAAEAERAVCDTFTAIWLKSFVPGSASKLASIGARMVKMHIPPELVSQHLIRLERISNGDDANGWGLEEESMWLCDHSRMCMVAMGEYWAENREGKEKPNIGGLTHPQGSCMARDDDHDEVTFVRICDEAGQYINIVPQECFRLYNVLTTNKNVHSKIGSRTVNTITGSGRAFEFYPDNYSPGFSKAVSIDDERLNRKLCTKPLSSLWNIELQMSTDDLKYACPQG